MIFVECKPDLLLVSKVTGKSKKDILHSGNKGEVIKNLSRSKGAIGVVDEDPGHAQPKYIKSMTLIKDDKQADIKIYRNSKDNLLIVLCPVLEPEHQLLNRKVLPFPGKKLLRRPKDTKKYKDKFL